ncbi:MAG TPA: DUF1566 domain-containing protein [Candidatus Margulisiibacteriota bacterium]|nr:DUF1566 domain-containing protein [Candidatus Margulisiibacteriota bacterium]
MNKHHMGMVGALVATLAVRTAVAQPCPGDLNCDQRVTIDEILTAVNAALSGCPASASCAARLPASGQTTSYGPGSDGAVRAGAALAYTDNGDGTLTDNSTGLMWEKKDSSGGIHDQDNTYTWGTTVESNPMDGTMVTEFLATLNRQPCFAGHCDWRIPNLKELLSIVDYEILYPGPAVDAAFNTRCATGCVVDGNGGPMCSCTASSSYWSSTTVRTTPGNAWDVFFGSGDAVSTSDKRLTRHAVRAVRGGL